MSMFLPISAGSMSMWIFLASAAKVSRFAVALSENLVPTASSTSVSEIKRLAAGFPCMPMLPTDMGWTSGMAPLPMKVVATGAISRSESLMSSSEALEVMTPPPASMRGFWALASILAAAFIWARSGVFTRLYPRASIWLVNSTSAVWACTFLGRSISTGPGLPVVAM